MAEFREVLLRWDDICKSNGSCSSCKLNGKWCPTELSENKLPSDDELEEFETIVMKKPKTNRQKVAEVLGVSVTNLTLIDCGGFRCPVGHDCKNCEYNDFWRK